ncbi:swr complex subunit [Collariella sp. IMI 366227]|nr:swr complex subunit [Collariella sp. IMI 366227]
MPPELAHDEDYASEEDSDFAPDDAPAEESSVSDDEDEADAAQKPKPGKRKRDGDEAGDAGFENSGDEAIVEKGKKRQRKSKRKDGEDEGGEGGLIKTRRMRAAEKEEKRTKAASGPVTVDVDALWAQMTSEPIHRKDDTTTTRPKPDGAPKPSSQPTQDPKVMDDSDLIRIKRTYNFAGKVVTEEKLAFRSAFEPVTADGLNQRSDLHLGMSERLRARELAKETDAKKLNTVEKSRMDWAGFVDREGIKDELELAGKSKHSFAARQDFLARSEMVREEEARKMRAVGRGN